MKNFIYKVIAISIIVFTLTLTSLFTFKEQTTTVNATEGNTPNIEIYKYNVSYSSEIYIAYAVAYKDININNSKIQMLFWNSIQDEYVKGTESYIETSKGISSIGNVNCCVYYSRGLAAKEMTTDVYARAYVKIGDKEYYSEVVKFSVLEYIEKMREENSATSGQSKLFDTMLQYGGAAQNNFNYKTDRPADGKYYGVHIKDGYLPDGFDHGRYLEGEKVVIKAHHKDGMKFAYWTDANGIIISYDKEFEININIKIDFTAHYKDIDISSQLAMSKEVTYDTTSDKLELPDAVAFEDEDSSVTLDITWDTTKFTANKIGTQRLYATLKDETMYEKYNIKTTDIYMDITVLPYTYSLNTSTNKYMITGYYGIDEKITIPTSYNNTLITTIQAKAFNEVTTLKEVVIPNTIEKIELAAFYNCDNIESISIPFTGESKSSSNSWFGYIFGATSKNVQNDILPSKLVTVILNEGVTSIRSYSFYWCSSLTSIELPSSLTSIDSDAFYYCDGLTSIELSSSLISIGSSAFCNCSSLENVYYGGTIEDWCNITFRDKWSNPMYYAKHFYMEDSNKKYQVVTEIVIPNTITNMGNYQLCGFKASISFEVDSNLTSIGTSSFAYCSNLTSIVIPSSVISIGTLAFSDCSSLTSIVIPVGVISIGDSAFHNCSGLTSIEIPSSIMSIGSAAFSSCSSLTSIKFEKGSQLTSINDNLFSECSSLKNVIFEEGSQLTTIGMKAFRKCSGLISIEIPSGVTKIKDYAFLGCTSLISVKLPSSITSISSSAFKNVSFMTDNLSSCISLTNVYYDGTIEDWCSIIFSNSGSNPMSCAQHFYMKDSNDEYREITEIEIPETITSIGTAQFCGFVNLTNIKLHNDITNIGSSAFSSCSSLTSINIPSSVTSIGSDAFYGCSNLTIYCEAESAPSEWDSSWNYSNCPVVWGYKEDN